MDFDLTEEQRAFQSPSGQFADEVVAPAAAGYDERGEFPYDIVKQMGEMGLFGLPFPEDVGGQGSDLTHVLHRPSRSSRGSTRPSRSRSRPRSGSAASPINRYGSPEQKERWLGPMCRGEVLGAFGADRARRRIGRRGDADHRPPRERRVGRSTARRPSSRTAAPTSSVSGRGGRDAGAERGGISAIIVPANTPGLTVGRSYRKVGWHASDTHELVVRRLPRARGEPAGRARSRLHAVPRRRSTRAGSPSPRCRWGSRRDAWTSRPSTRRRGGPSASPSPRSSRSSSRSRT